MEYVRFRYLNLRIRPMKEVREYTTRYYQATVNPFWAPEVPDVNLKKFKKCNLWGVSPVQLCPLNFN